MADLNNEILAEIRKLPKAEQQELSKILQSLGSGDTSKLRSFLQEDYVEQPVSISQFIHDDRYMARPLTDDQGGFLIYPYWEDKLRLIYESDAVEVIFTGPIGGGKSTIMDICMAYDLHSILCLRDPFGYYNLVRAQPITFLFFSISKDLSNVGLFKGFSQMLLKSPWFTERGTISGSRNQTVIFPQHNVEYSLGSPKVAGQGITGKNIISGGLDEISAIGSSKEQEGNVDFSEMKGLEVYQNVKRRIESRFLQHGMQPGRLYLASSKQDDAAFLERYIEKVKGSRKVIIFDDPLWEIKPRDYFSGETFVVAVGDRFRESKVLEKNDNAEEFETKGYDIIEPPIEFLESFRFDVNGALRDIAGISSSSTRRSKLIPRAEYLKRCIKPGLIHPFSSEVVYLAEEDEIGIEDYFQLRDEFLSPRPRFIHVDLALNGDACGMAMCHVSGRKIVDRIMGDGTITKMADDIVRYDFVVQIRNMEGSEIPFWKIRRFVLWLYAKGVKIEFVTFDGWQSIDSQQLLNRAGIPSDVLSLDKNDGPYVTWRTAVYEERVEYYEYPIFMKEAADLEHNRRKKKVDHPHLGCFVGDTRIPLLDGSCPTIEELDGKEVWLYSCRPDGCSVPGKARGRLTKHVTDLVDVVLDSGAVVRCTPEHLWMFKGGAYEQAKDLRPGVDRLMSMNRVWPVKVRYVIPVHLEKEVSVYDLEVYQWSNFFLSAGVVVHNSKDVTDASAGCLNKAVEGSGTEPQPQKTVEAMQVMIERIGHGGLNKKWWLNDI